MVHYPHIFQPLRVKSLHMKNRIGIPPIGSNFAALDGAIRDEHINYYIRRALGGPGLIIVENVNIDYPMGTNGTTQLRLDDDQYIPGIFTLVEKLQALGTAVSVQLNHAGAGAYAGRLNGAEMVSASNIPAKQGMKAPRPLEVKEIEDIAEKFGQGARRAKQAGFESVEIHAGHAYLLSQFLSPYYNRRTDAFGGSPENRARFPKMVAQAVRRAVGPNFAVSMRISADEMFPEGNSLKDTLQLLEVFADDIDIFNVSAGIMESLWFTMDRADLEDGWKANLAEAIRKRFGKPVMVAGNIRKPATAERILAEGKADIILIGRGHIAEPDWVKKTAAGLEDQIRPCISCNIGCCGNRMGGSKPIRCSVNPDVVESRSPSKTGSPLNVVIIGGGTAGLEAACTASEAGHNVTLFEKEQNVGGLAESLSRMPHKKRIGDFVTWLKNRAKQQENLQIHTSHVLATEDLDKLDPALIVVATGASPALPPIPGLKEAVEKKRVHTASDILKDPEIVNNLKGKKIVIAGGGAVGLDIAEWCLDGGASDITIIEQLPQIGVGLDLITRSAALDMIKKHNIQIISSAEIIKVKDHSFVIKQGNDEREISFDRGFTGLGMTPGREAIKIVETWLPGHGAQMVEIGDARSGRRILEGIREARNIVNILKELEEA